MHIDEYEEDYLIPVPDVKVKGIWSGAPYPELHGKYSIVSSTGIVSELKFEGKGILLGTKHSVQARVYDIQNASEDIYS
ncbi:hypothetical protein, partial [Oceanobacillus saliphilus]|uniref:hypothetical protein n=1 Tax=Oceanobacillus saliphilus TaxID=2925834 RepID=UPI00201D37C8